MKANLSLFEAYVQYCYSPKHTVGEQLLNVRRDKRERAAFQAAAGDRVTDDEQEDNGDDDDRDPEEDYRVEMEAFGSAAGDPRDQAE